MGLNFVHFALPYEGFFNNWSKTPKHMLMVNYLHRYTVHAVWTVNEVLKRLLILLILGRITILSGYIEGVT